MSGLGLVLARTCCLHLARLARSVPVRAVAVGGRLSRPLRQ